MNINYVPTKLNELDCFFPETGTSSRAFCVKNKIGMSIRKFFKFQEYFDANYYKKKHRISFSINLYNDIIR